MEKCSQMLLRGKCSRVKRKQERPEHIIGGNDANRIVRGADHIPPSRQIRTTTGFTMVPHDVIHMSIEHMSIELNSIGCHVTNDSNRKSQVLSSLSVIRILSKTHN
ncbi:hypothetical protein KC19_1G072700 [Ceratodon purpureus]|uniref:Uncharacterized protein n=1 Tax=Ceratodon purpureus TaxID=3225 RepID=A0A8T0J4G2_CERPU|nr:hypothetical protein KC19_1G072700 [Ceratodon purpureus]